MYKLLFFVAIIFSLVSCNNQKEESTPNNTEQKPGILHCYEYINNRDTVKLKTILVNGFITGTLLYNLYEKDKNEGTIQGQMKGDLLVADYTFNAEGTTSIRQVGFKKSGNNFIEGFGETEFKNDKSFFKNIDSLDFSGSLILKETDCEK